MDIKDLYKEIEKYIDKDIEISGWIRNHRPQKEFGFIGFNDGTTQNGIQVVLACGPLMQKMLKVLPKSIQTQWAETPEKVLETLKEIVKTGDTVLVKSSHGTGLYRLVKQIKGEK